MMRRLSLLGIFVLAAAGAARADFSYEQSTKITGGMMAGMMKFAGAFSKQAREPMQLTISVKGDRMAMISPKTINIIDLSAETMTDVDLEKRTYTVITFADLSRAMQKLAEKMGQSDANVNFKADVKQTGASRTINGLQAKQTVLTLTMEGQDQKSGQTGAMNVVTDMWLAPDVPGYDEVRKFYTRMAEKLAFAPGMGSMSGMMGRQAGMMKGMSELYKEASKMDGVPVLQVVRMGGTMEGVSEADLARAQADAERAQQNQAPPPTAGDVAGAAATSAAASRMGRLGGLAGGLGGGGFGGFGRRKKEAQEQPAQTQSQTAAAAPAQHGSGSSASAATGTLMELTTELTAFSSAPVDSAKLSVPAGFKQVEHELQKNLK